MGRVFGWIAGVVLACVIVVSLEITGLVLPFLLGFFLAAVGTAIGSLIDAMREN